MRRRSWLKLLLAAALAVSTMAVIVTAAGAQEGRDAGSEPGPAVEAPDAGGGGNIIEAGDWDGDGPAPRDQQILDDLIVDGSLCVGLDCVNGESFGFDTVRLKENNLRIHFQDTSTSASFPPRDWRIVINDTTNGGASYFAIEDTDASRQPVRITADSQAWAIYTTSNRVGFGTNTPVVELHVVDGDTPTLRLEQDGSSGFTAQTFDVAGNEANFFVRDVTNGSKLIFKIKPGAPTSSLFVAASGNIGLQTENPDANLHIRNTSGRARIHLEDTSAGTPATWRLGTANNGRVVWSSSNAAGGAFSSNQFTLDENGNAFFQGDVFANNQSVTPLDEWFVEDIEALRAENAALRAELDALKKTVDALVAAQN